MIDQADGGVQDGDDRQRRQDADRHVALRVLGLLGRGGDDVEADEGEEHDGRAGDDAAEAEDGRLDAEQAGDQRQLAETAAGVGGRLRLGDERRPVADVDEREADDDDDRDDEELDRRRRSG